MLKRYFSRLFITFLLSTCVLNITRAQTSDLEKKTDVLARKVVEYLNQGLPDSAYQLTGTNFRKQINPALWNNIYKTQLSAMIPFTEMKFIGSKDSVNRYKLTGKVTLTLYAGLDAAGRIYTFMMQPYQEEVTQTAMTEAERKTDLLARKILKLVNAKQADSIYSYAGDVFKSQLDAITFKSVFETGISPLIPLPDAIFIGSKNGVNKYKVNQLQFLIGLDSKNKISTLLFQPYREDAVKAEKAASDNPLKSKLDSLVNKILTPYIQTKGNAGLSAAVYYKGREHFYNYGSTSLDKQVLPNSHSLYDIGSITKTFTSSLLVIAAKQGKVSISAPITNYLPDSLTGNPALKKITLKQLANHTSGLPRMPTNILPTVKDNNQPYEFYSKADMFSFLRHFKEIREPGADYEYSNFGAALLGVILETVYNKPYEQLIKQYITVPAGLNETKIGLSAADMARVTQGYNEVKQPVPVWKFESMAPAGALKSTAADMLNYARLQLPSAAGPLSQIFKQTHPVTYKKGSNIIGLGWQFQGDENFLQHGGGTGGYRSMVCVVLDRDIAVVMLTNNASTGDATGINLAQAIKGLK